MFKFFRKYQKIIILVGLPILLIIFLVPQAIQGIAEYSARRGRTFGTFTTLAGEQREVSAVEFQQAQRDLAVLSEGLQFNILQAFGMGDVDQPEHWLLLVHEAEQNGLIGGEADARLFAQNIVDLLTQALGQSGTSPEMIMAQMASQTRLGVRSVVGALSRAWGVQRLLNLYAGEIKISTPRLQSVANDLLHGIDARMLAIPASADGEGLPEPTEEELQAHLEKYAGVSPGEGERGFGYRLPDRVKLEWLRVDAQRFREALRENPQMDRLELRKYFLRNKEQFTPGIAPGNDPATVPEEPTFEDVEDRVREQRLTELTRQVLDEIARFIEGEAANRLRGLPRERFYYELPDDWPSQRLAYDQLALQLQEFASDRFDIAAPLAEYERDPDWHAVPDVRLISGLGRAATEKYGARMTLADLLPELREFGGSERVPLQAGVTGPTLRLNDLRSPGTVAQTSEASLGTIFAFRVYEADPSRPAESVDEVRDELVADLKRIAHFERLEASIDELRRTATTEGLTALAEAHDVRPLPVRDIGYVENPQLQQQMGIGGQPLPQPIGRDPDVIRQIVELGKDRINRMLTENIPFEEIPLAERTFVIPVPQKLAVLVGQFTDLEPLVRDRYSDYVFALRLAALQDEVDTDNAFQTFSYESMMDRYKYQSTTGSDEEEAADEAAEAETETAAAQ